MWLRQSMCSERSMTLQAQAIRSVLGESERGRHRGKASMSVNLEATGIQIHTHTHTREDLRSLAVK